MSHVATDRKTLNSFRYLSKRVLPPKNVKFTMIRKESTIGVVASITGSLQFKSGYGSFDNVIFMLCVLKR